MTKVLFGIFICLVFFKMELKSQENNSWTIYPAQKEVQKEKAKTNNEKKVKGSNITTIEDERIGNLLEKENEINKSKGTMKGFRVEIYYASGAESRTLARKVQSDFIKQFPDSHIITILREKNNLINKIAHSSETEWINYNFDTILQNDNSIDDLKSNLKSLLSSRFYTVS